MKGKQQNICSFKHIPKINTASNQSIHCYLLEINQYTVANQSLHRYIVGTQSPVPIPVPVPIRNQS